jgi:hypothetical protein
VVSLPTPSSRLLYSVSFLPASSFELRASHLSPLTSVPGVFHALWPQLTELLLVLLDKLWISIVPVFGEEGLERGSVFFDERLVGRADRVLAGCFFDRGTVLVDDDSFSVIRFVAHSAAKPHHNGILWSQYDDIGFRAEDAGER